MLEAHTKSDLGKGGMTENLNTAPTASLFPLSLHDTPLSYPPDPSSCRSPAAICLLPKITVPQTLYLTSYPPPISSQIYQTQEHDFSLQLTPCLYLELYVSTYTAHMASTQNLQNLCWPPPISI